MLTSEDWYLVRTWNI